MNRRRLLQVSAVWAGSVWLGKSHAQATNPSEGLRRAAGAFLETLGQRRAAANLALGSQRRLDWHWFPTWNREGLMLGDMNPAQRQSALALLRSSVSEAGYTKALEIMALQRDLGRSPDNYYFTIYGDPTAQNWAWAVEGHHLSLNYTIAGSRIAAAPLFLGASPTYTGNVRRATMRREEEAARELLRSLDTHDRSRLIFSASTPGDTVTRNAIQVRPLEAVGVPLANLGSGQQTLALEAIRAYLSMMPPAVAAARLEQVQRELPQARFGWAGALEPRNHHYYRFQGDSFLLEHDNSRDGGTHIHSVWRDFENDFGAAWL